MVIRTTGVGRLFDVIDDLVDERVGIIRGVSEVRARAGAPDFFHYAAEACNVATFCGQKNFANSGGASADRKMAMAKAVGESVERYCSAQYVRHELPLASVESAPFRCIDPSKFALFSPEQYSQSGFPYIPFTKDTPLRWTKAVDLVSQEECHLPACMVYVPYRYDRDVGEHMITQPISTGLACHCSWTEAAISAICEVIERDAFMITWQAMLPAPPIRLDSLSDENQDLVGRFERTGDSVRLLNLTLDHGVPTVLAILASDRPRSPALVFSASAALSPEEAVRKSLEELAHTHRYAVQLNATLQPFVPEADYSNIINQGAHVRLYTEQARRNLASFLFSSEAWIEFRELNDLSADTPAAGLRNLVEAIAATNHRILVKDLTTPDIQDLGLPVLRAVVPGFPPPFMGHGNRALGGARLWSIPQALGYAGIRGWDNPAPHPYP